MRASPLRGDLGLLREGLELGRTFGVGSLEELARTAWELEHGIYRVGSLAASERGVSFELTNPPLRVGAFGRVALRWDGAEVDPTLGWVATDRRPALRTLASVTPASPIELEVGEGSRFEIALAAPVAPGRHSVRVEWRSVAVPPLVWLEFSDEPRRRPGPGGPTA